MFDTWYALDHDLLLHTFTVILIQVDSVFPNSLIAELNLCILFGKVCSGPPIRGCYW